MQKPTPNFNRGLLRYVQGDATLPRGGGHRMLIHCCNDVGAWGSGFVVAISKRWKKPEEQYRLWRRAEVLDRVKFQLGEIQIVDIQTDLSVVNMIAQRDIMFGTAPDGTPLPPIRYDALKACLNKVAKEAKDRQSSIHGPRFGAGLAGGEWGIVERLINECLIDKGINVTIYDFEEKK